MSKMFHLFVLDQRRQELTLFNELGWHLERLLWFPPLKWFVSYYAVKPPDPNRPDWYRVTIKYRFPWKRKPSWMK